MGGTWDRGVVAECSEVDMQGRRMMWQGRVIGLA